MQDGGQRLRRAIAAMYGMGLALAFDEFGMWLHLRDGYWVRQSYDALLVISAWLINAVYFMGIWRRLLRRLLRRWRRAAAAQPDRV